jgi:hypothetical protein
VFYRQELYGFWQRGSPIQVCSCPDCPTPQNVTETTCWYNKHESNSKRFKDTRPKAGHCEHKKHQQFIKALIALGVLTFFFGLATLCFFKDPNWPSNCMKDIQDLQDRMDGDHPNQQQPTAPPYTPTNETLLDPSPFGAPKAINMSPPPPYTENPHQLDEMTEIDIIST